MELPFPSIAALFIVALVAGLVDAIAGGGGLLTVPALLATGLPAHLVLGTNKGASVFGAAAALFRFWRAGFLHRGLLGLFFLLGLVGSFLGATLQLWLDQAVLRPVALLLLVAAGVAVGFAREPQAERVPLAGARLRAAAAVLAVGLGAYDGFFGPGTGTFLILGCVAWLGFDLPRASANAKVVNFASNLAAVLLFASSGTILWKISLPMAAGQLVGGTLGAHLAIKGGGRVIRWVVLAVVVALVARLGYDLVVSR